MLHHQIFPPSTHAPAHNYCVVYVRRNTLPIGTSTLNSHVYPHKKGVPYTHVQYRHILHIHVVLCAFIKEDCIMCNIHPPTCVHSYSLCTITHGHCLYKETGKWWVGELHIASQFTSTWITILTHAVYYVYVCLCVHTWIESGKSCKSVCTRVDWKALDVFGKG